MLLIKIIETNTITTGTIDTDIDAIFANGTNYYPSQVEILGEVTGPAIEWSAVDLSCDSVYSKAGDCVSRMPDVGDTIYIGGSKSRHYICTKAGAYAWGEDSCEITPVV